MKFAAFAALTLTLTTPAIAQDAIPDRYQAGAGVDDVKNEAFRGFG